MYPDGHDILVIDDNPARRHLIDRFLRREGFAVTAVAEGLAAIREARARRFALVVAAVDLPGSLDGMTTTSQLRARQPWLKVLFIGDATKHPAWCGRDFCEFIASPFHRNELIGCVFELLQRDGIPGADLLRSSRLELRVR